MVAVVAACCLSAMPLLLVDGHLPYPAAILQVFGVVRHGRRRGGRGRRKLDRLVPPKGLMLGIVEKVRDAAGHLIKVRHKALFGRRKQIRRLIRKLKLGAGINTAHIERLNGTCRGCVARLARRTRDVSRRRTPLIHALALWRDVYNWVRPHGSLNGSTPAMAAGLATEVWPVVRYVMHPVHADDMGRAIWLEQQQTLLTSALSAKNHRKALPIS
jgi:hypothetical protein